MKFKTWQFLLIFIYGFYQIFLVGGCASQKTIQGGPRDSIAPKVLKMLPENLTTNFNAKTITIQFDEYFKLNDQFREFSVSPDMERLPQLKIKKRALEISFQDTLEKNTTYTLNFGKSIADINENNVLKNFTYVFATGPKLDSLSISGQVVDALTGEPILDALAFIVPIDRDTIIGKAKPSIYATTDSSGRFQLNNLRENTYKVYALKEKTSDKIYQQVSDEIGFLPDSIVLNANVSDLKIKVFKEDPQEFRIIDRKIAPDGTILITWNQKLRQPSVVITEPSNLDASKQFQFSKTNDSVRVWLNDLSFDSTKVSIMEAGKLLQTVKLTRGKKDTYTRALMPADNLEGGQLNPNKRLRLTFPTPVLAIDRTKIQLLEDSVAVTNFQLLKDSADFLSYYVQFPWDRGTEYEMKFNPGAITGMFDSKNKEFTKAFELASADDYGSLGLSIKVPEANKSYVVQVTNEKKETISEHVIRHDTTLNFTNYRAGKYFLRVVYDNNGNGIWDTGRVSLKQLPEQIYNELQELSIRANWDRKATVTIPKEPASGTSPST
ncbi:Ig-like domain-containing protein [Pedobacter sp. SAFR-022]|uniref:Ig-like domain-containing protein n=1 Tax=Pedobacter sp. SAFR-022 TaxID=3436861 RepID=UPI003F7EE3AE